MSTVAGRRDPPEFHETHLLRRVGGAEERELGGEEGGGVDAVAGEDYGGCVLVGLGGGRGGAIGVVRGVVVVLRYGVGDCLFRRGGLVDGSGRGRGGDGLEGEVASEESGELFLCCCHGGKPARGGSVRCTVCIWTLTLRLVLSSGGLCRLAL